MVRGDGRASLSPERTLWALLAVDATLYLDAALRWELGLGFLRPRWLLVSLLVGAVLFLFDHGVVKFRVNGALHGLMTFPLWCWAFVMASTGNPQFDWHALPVVDFFRSSWLDAWLGWGGFLTAGIASAVHFMLGFQWRNAKPRDLAPFEASWPPRLGWALMVAACVTCVPAPRLLAPVTAPNDPAYEVYRDPRDVTESKRQLLDWVRRASGFVVLGAGAWLLISAKLRASST